MRPVCQSQTSPRLLAFVTRGGLQKALHNQVEQAAELAQVQTGAGSLCWQASGDEHGVGRPVRSPPLLCLQPDAGIKGVARHAINCDWVHARTPKPWCRVHVLEAVAVTTVTLRAEMCAAAMHRHTRCHAAVNCAAGCSNLGAGAGAML